MSLPRIAARVELGVLTVFFGVVLRLRWPALLGWDARFFYQRMSERRTR